MICHTPDQILVIWIVAMLFGMFPGFVIGASLKNRKSLAVAPNGHTTPFLTVEEWSRIADFLKDYDFQPRQTSPGQSTGVEAMARELAKRASSGDTLAQSRIEGRVLSFAARVAADQRERDAKIAETPDQQRANKTAAQIAAAIRTQGEE